MLLSLLLRLLCFLTHDLEHLVLAICLHLGTVDQVEIQIERGLISPGQNFRKLVNPDSTLLFIGHSYDSFCILDPSFLILIILSFDTTFTELDLAKKVFIHLQVSSAA
jgi:hypothetical protein